jgi:hypothetical protein
VDALQTSGLDFFALPLSRDIGEGILFLPITARDRRDAGHGNDCAWRAGGGGARRLS